MFLESKLVQSSSSFGFFETIFFPKKKMKRFVQDYFPSKNEINVRETQVNRGISREKTNATRVSFLAVKYSLSKNAKTKTRSCS